MEGSAMDIYSQDREQTKDADNAFHITIVTSNLGNLSINPAISPPRGAMAMQTLRSCLEEMKVLENVGATSSRRPETADEDEDRVVWISRPYKLPDFLSRGRRYPAFALYYGRWSHEQCQIYFSRGLAAGYRHIETHMYNEQEGIIAHVLESARIPREKVFITSIIRFSKSGTDATLAAIRKHAFGISEVYPIDLMLTEPIPEDCLSRRQLWQTLEKAVEQGTVRSIGVCNYSIELLDELKKYAKIWPPAVNQLELHPWRQQRELVSYCYKNDIILATSAPTARDRMFHDTKLLELTKKYNFKHPAQLLIRYAIQKEWLVVMTTHIQYAETFVQDDRTLPDEAMESLDDLDGKSASLFETHDDSGTASRP